MKIINSYIADLPQPRRERAEALHRLVLQMFPLAEVSMHYKMPTYHWRGNFLAWGSKKNYLSVYTCSHVRIAAFNHKHPDIPCGVGCLNFRDTDAFPVDDLEQVVINALAPSSCILRDEREAKRSAREPSTAPACADRTPRPE
jgi:uncharacterized protein YdhG (YjbR/CyaY superfamily)